jgi:hypothetical protein
MKKLLVLLALLVGCAKDPEALHRTSNPEVEVGELFTHDGCTIYRFYDAGNSHHYVVCDGSRDAQTIRDYDSSGKHHHTHIHENIRTVSR